MLKFLILVIFLLLASTVVYAHGTGYSFNKVVGKYLVDIGYDNDPFLSGQTSSFNFLLSDNKTRDPVEFDDIWVRIQKGQKTVFATGLDAGLAFSPTMLYTFGEPGGYTLNIRYEKEGETLAETSFPIKVVQEGFNLMNFVPWMGGMVIGLALSLGVFLFVMPRVKRGKE